VLRTVDNLGRHSIPGPNGGLLGDSKADEACELRQLELLAMQGHCGVRLDS
jgi:hypothetical protein